MSREFLAGQKERSKRSKQDEGCKVVVVIDPLLCTLGMEGRWWWRGGLGLSLFADLPGFSGIAAGCLVIIIITITVVMIIMRNKVGPYASAYDMLLLLLLLLP